MREAKGRPSGLVGKTPGRAFARFLVHPTSAISGAILPDGQITSRYQKYVNPLSQKYSYSGFQKCVVLCARPASIRGVRVVTNVEAGCDGRFDLAGRAMNEADGEGAWS